ncbi:MAG: biopolymer transporter ExbD [Gemmobacter sp.]|nr:biopolymer transporter ExbD [Gemmobacter sp.]
MINVVFLLLMFFLVAGTVAPAPLGTLDLVRLSDSDPVIPPDVLAISATGQTLWRGGPADPLAYLAALPPEAMGVARLMPDRDLSASTLLRIARTLREAGARDLRLVTQRGDP